jgi:hypothetical protein
MCSLQAAAIARNNKERVEGVYTLQGVKVISVSDFLYFFDGLPFF